MVDAKQNCPSLWLWAPRYLTWWIAVLFMMGSSLFALGCLLFLLEYEDVFLNGLVFFAGSIFFTSAAYCQYHQVINRTGNLRVWFSWQSGAKGFLAAVTQFIGTVFFNFNTFDSLFEMGWIEQELLIWVPNIIGSILFQVSGTVAMFDISRRWWNMKKREINWWIGIIGFLGCVAFMISAVLALVTPHPLHAFAQWATIFTGLGAVCFFISAYLMIPELSLQLKEAKLLNFTSTNHQD